MPSIAAVRTSGSAVVVKLGSRHPLRMLHLPFRVLDLRDRTDDGFPWLSPVRGLTRRWGSRSMSPLDLF